jgi:hypothetical protein
MSSVLFWDVGPHQLGASCRRFGNIVSVPSSSVTLEDGTETLLQAVCYKLPHNTVQSPKRAINSYTALRNPVFFSCLASTGFHRWATTVLRVYRIHFVGVIWVSTQEFEFAQWKRIWLTAALYICGKSGVKSCEEDMQILLCVYTSVHCYIYTFEHRPSMNVITYHHFIYCKNHTFVIYFIYLLINYFLIFVFIRYLLLIMGQVAQSV